MISEPSYRAARVIAERIEKQFAEKLDIASRNGELNLAPAPTEQVVEAMIDAAFWASLRREEGRPPRISMAFLPPWQAERPLLFEQRLPLRSGVLTKLAPGIERAGIHLGVWIEDDELYIWGTTLLIPDLCFVVDVSEPGLLVIKYRRLHGFGKYANLAVLIGDQVKLVDEQWSRIPERPALLSSLLFFNTPSIGGNSLNVLIQLGVSMRAHGKGGALLVVPSNSDAWENSMIHPIAYRVKPSFNGLADLIKQEVSQQAVSEQAVSEQAVSEGNKNLWRAAIRREIESMAGLTAIDGATIINQDYGLLAFGGKIGRAPGSRPIPKVLFTEPVVGGKSEVAHPAERGGTRHLSAAQFVYDQRDAMALVASQDGHFSIYFWSPQEDMVQAHRIDILLL